MSATLAVPGAKCQRRLVAADTTAHVARLSAGMPGRSAGQPASPATNPSPGTRCPGGSWSTAPFTVPTPDQAAKCRGAYPTGWTTSGHHQPPGRAAEMRTAGWSAAAGPCQAPGGSTESELYKSVWQGRLHLCPPQAGAPCAAPASWVHAFLRHRLGWAAAKCWRLRRRPAGKPARHHHHAGRAVRPGVPSARWTSSSAYRQAGRQACAVRLDACMPSPNRTDGRNCPAYKSCQLDDPPNLPLGPE